APAEGAAAAPAAGAAAAPAAGAKPAAAAAPAKKYSCAGRILNVSVSDPAVVATPRLIVGLGNPGREYEDTRHNIGFMIVDALAAQLQISWTLEKRWGCMLAKFTQGWLPR